MRLFRKLTLFRLGEFHYNWFSSSRLSACSKKIYATLTKGEKAQLGIFWREERDIRQQIARWCRPAARESAHSRLDRLIPRLVALHRNLLANSQAADTLLAQELAEIARFASRR